jgi:hypothetical protein
MTKDETLQMCLEYIETDAHERKYVRHAIKQALAEPTVQEPVAWMPIETAPQDGTKILGWNEKFGARETQMNFYGEGSPGFAAWKSGKGPKESGWNWSEPKSNWSHTWKPTHWKPLLTPFNTTPPAAQRQFVGLTDEEIKHMLELFVIPPHHVEMVVQAIEAKLRSKNNG